MTSPPFILQIPLLTALMLNSVGAQNASLRRGPKARPNPEPFRSLAILDSKLSVLTTQQAALDASVNRGSTPSGTTTPSHRYQTLVTNMNATTKAIMGRISHLESLYRKRRRQFGVKAFKLMARRARMVRRELAVLQKTQGKPARQAAEKRLAERITALVVQFQAVSGGHEATHCRPHEWTCCEPKRAKDLMPDQEVGCRWMCLPNSNKCTGLLGPRIPALSNTTAQ
jgi:hypothetical protein